METIELPSVTVFDGTRTLPGSYDVTISGGSVGALEPAAGAPTAAILPGLVDAHVHVALSKPAAIVAGGVTRVLDLGAPATDAFRDLAPLRVRWAGPLITPPGGYPTRTWGANGFGLEVRDADEARHAVSMLADRGAAFVKLAFQDEPMLEVPVAAVCVEEARRRGVRSAAHAITVEAVERALAAGVDALAHTPVEPLPPETIDALVRAGTTIVSTWRAFGASPAALANLRALAEAGCPIVYGTDLGNPGIEPGADPEELRMLRDVLGSHDAALAAATTGAAAFCGFALEPLVVGARADLIVADSTDFDALRSPRAIFVDGERIA